MHPPFFSAALPSLAVSMVIVACGHNPKSAPEIPVGEGAYTAVTPLPVRDESVSFHGPGSAKVDKDQFPAIRFSPDSYLLPEDAAATLDSVASHLEITGASAILAGFTDPGEVNRVLGERRALSVRQGLIDRGASPDKLQTVSYGHDLPPSAETSDRRVEFGIIRGNNPSRGSPASPVAATP